MNEEKFAARNHCLNLPLEEDNSIFYKIRKFILNRFGVWDFVDILPYKWRMFYYDHIRTIFKPYHKKLRKSIPRQWADISSLIVDVNFKFVEVFYEDEYKADIVDWSATEHHKEFANWLETAYSYITKERPQLHIELDNAYPPSKPISDMFKLTTDEQGKQVYQMVDDGIPYNIKYAEVNRIEKIINDKDTELLTEIIKRRDYFWT